jgi:hypothetical protein
MDKVTQSNAANAEETAASAQELNAQAETMKGLVADLVKLVGGHADEMDGGRADAGAMIDPSGPMTHSNHANGRTVSTARQAGNGHAGGRRNF